MINLNLQMMQTDGYNLDTDRIDGLDCNINQSWDTLGRLNGMGKIHGTPKLDSKNPVFFTLGIQKRF
jgi:hypothetical protein